MSTLLRLLLVLAGGSAWVRWERRRDAAEVERLMSDNKYQL